MNKSKTNEPDLFSYMDYRAYLRDFYLAQKSSQKGFSLRSFSDAAELGSSNLLKLVMDGERNLGGKALAGFIKALGLNKMQSAYFKDLVEFNQSTNHEQKNSIYQRLISFHQVQQLKPLEKAKYRYYTEWYHPVVRELITHPAFDGDLQNLGQRLNPAVSVVKIEESIQLLQQLQLIEKNGARYQTTNNLVTTGAEAQSVVLMNYHKTLLRLVHHQLDRIPSDQRDISALTLGVRTAQIPLLKKRIQEFRKEILQMVADEDKAEDVVLLTMQFLPVTRSPRKAKP